MVRFAGRAVAGLLFIGFTSFSSSLSAAQFQSFFGLGYDHGGDVIYQGTYTDGSPWEVRANSGLLFRLGGAVATGNFKTLIDVGFKRNGTNAKNGEITFDVVPIEILEYYCMGNFRIGIGAIYHTNPKIKLNIPGYSGNGSYFFENTVGSVIEMSWVFSQDKDYITSIDVRGTTVRFTEKDVPNPAEYKGDVLGINLSMYFF